MADEASPAVGERVKLRSYQQEMLDESMKRNVIVAMDTGSGKTHVAIARIQAELERSPPGKV
jgi:ERCC4-related helicase